MVGLFGGSFDPIHHGHLILARVALESLGLSAVRFIPAAEQPLKRGQHAASAADRAAMVECAIAGVPGFELDRVELERRGPSYTVETLRGFTAAEPGTQFVLLLGADAARDLPRWKEPQAVAAMAEIAVFDRPGNEGAGEGAWRRIDAPRLEISATEIRARVRAGRSIRFWVPDAVAEYIAAHGLYRDAL